MAMPDWVKVGESGGFHPSSETSRTHELGTVTWRMLSASRKVLVSWVPLHHANPPTPPATSSTSPSAAAIHRA